MEIRYGLFYFGVIFFVAMAAVAFVRAYREKERVFYLGGVLSLFGVAWSLLIILDQVPLAGLFLVSSFIIAFGVWPEFGKFQLRKMRESDISGPLRVRDLFSYDMSGWLRVASRWGLEKAVLLYALLFGALAGGGLLVLSLIYDFVKVETALLIVITISVFRALWIYKQLKRALNSEMTARA